MISLEKWIILTLLQKLPNNVGNLVNIIVPWALKSCQKCKKSANLVTLVVDKKNICNAANLANRRQITRRIFHIRHWMDHGAL